MFLDAGEMPERLKGAVLKTAERKFRGFESLSLRWLCSRRSARTRSYPGEVTERLKVIAC
jgi:hypothetical protein